MVLILVLEGRFALEGLESKELNSRSGKNKGTVEGQYTPRTCEPGHCFWKS